MEIFVFSCKCWPKPKPFSQVWDGSGVEIDCPMQPHLKKGSQVKCQQLQGTGLIWSLRSRGLLGLHLHNWAEGRVHQMSSQTLYEQDESWGFTCHSTLFLSCISKMAKLKSFPNSSALARLMRDAWHMALRCPECWGYHLEQLWVWGWLQTFSSAWPSLLTCAANSSCTRFSFFSRGARAEWALQDHIPPLKSVFFILRVESHYGKSVPNRKKKSLKKKIKDLCFVRDMNSLLYVSFFSSVGTALPYPISAVYLLFAAEKY